MCIRTPDPPVYITDQLTRRRRAARDHLGEKAALREIAVQMLNDRAQVLSRLVDLAMTFCKAESGGISLYEADGDLFRWHHLRGRFERFQGSTVPRNDSPCGVTLDQRAPVLVQHPERIYAWLRDAGVPVPECLLVPLYVGEAEPLGTLWLVAGETGHFDAGHAELMEEFAGFSGIALAMIRTEDQLKAALEAQEMLTREMGHRVKNLFAIADAMIRTTARSAASAADLARELSGRLHALAEANSLVRRSPEVQERPAWASDLEQVVQAVLRPYAHATSRLHGPPVALGEQATNVVALVFHELATNAAKYGALGADAGSVHVEWTADGAMLDVTWTETGGPPVVAPPEESGFGTSLVMNSIRRQGGSIQRSWRPEGVQVKLAIPLGRVSA